MKPSSSKPCTSSITLSIQNIQTNHENIHQTHCGPPLADRLQPIHRNMLPAALLRPRRCLFPLKQPAGFWTSGSRKGTALRAGNRSEASIPSSSIFSVSCSCVNVLLSRVTVRTLTVRSPSSRADRQSAAGAEPGGASPEDGAATTKQLDDIVPQINAEQPVGREPVHPNNSVTSIDENASAIDLQIAQVEDQLTKCRISSPIDGLVLAKYVEAGELASPGRPIMKVADMERLYLRSYFTSDQLAGLQLGQEVTVVADFGADQQFEYPGKVTWISSESEFTPKSIQTRNSRANLVYAVKIAVQNDGRLKIGLSGTVVL